MQPMTASMLADKVAEIKDMLIQTANTVIMNGNAIIDLKEIMDMTNQMTVDILNRLTFLLSSTYAEVSNNVIRLNDLEILTYNLVETVSMVIKIAIGSFGLGVINTILIVALFSTLHSQRKCKCSKKKKK